MSLHVIIDANKSMMIKDVPELCTVCDAQFVSRQVVPTHRNDIPTSASRQAQCGTPRLDVLEVRVLRNLAIAVLYLTQSHVVGAGPEHYRALFSLEVRTIASVLDHVVGVIGPESSRGSFSAYARHDETPRSGQESSTHAHKTGSGGEEANVPGIGGRDAPQKRNFEQGIPKVTVLASFTLRELLRRICEETRSDLAKLKRENLDAARKIEKLKKDLKNCGNAQEADRLGQKILMDIKRVRQPIDKHNTTLL